LPARNAPQAHVHYQKPVGALVEYRYCNLKMHRRLAAESHLNAVCLEPPFVQVELPVLMEQATFKKNHRGAVV
jgi:hypothetical protein